VACKEPITLYSSINLWSRALIGARWLLRKDGLGATNHFETCGFIRSRPGVAYPDIQYHFLPMAVAYDGSSLAQEARLSGSRGTHAVEEPWLGPVGIGEPPRQTAHPVQLPEPADDWTEDARPACG